MRSLPALALMLALSAPVALFASPVTYTETVTGSGTLNGVAYTNQLITLKASGNTTGVTSPSTGIYTYFLPITLTVAGFSSTTFTDSVAFVANQVSMDAGVGDFTTGAAILFTNSAAFSTYNLQTSIGPVTGASGYNSGYSFNTVAGAFVINSASNATFQSVVTSTAVTPEPSSLVLLGTGCLSVAGMARRRFLRA